LSSSSYSAVVRFVRNTYTYRALTLAFDYTQNISVIFLITDFENFYKNPLSYGKFKCVPKDLLEVNQIDQNNLIFFWDYKIFNDGVIIEAPVMGSGQECFGSLKNIVLQLQQYIV
jgi:hypothetical protein